MCQRQQRCDCDEKYFYCNIECWSKNNPSGAFNQIALTEESSIVKLVLLQKVLNMALILVVDDSPTMMSATSKILNAAGHEVIQAGGGYEGIEKAASEKPDLILMDVVMPDINGFQATRKITTNPETKHIPVIILTTKDQETDKVWAMRQGAKDYIVKPPSKEELLSKIDQALGS
jgi:twitching motility two-component system response regulator PilH